MSEDRRVTVVTGAGRGLGRAYAHLLATEGHTVIVHDAGVGQSGEDGSREVADAVVSEISATGGNAVAQYQDLGSQEACRGLIASIVEQFGRLDALVHNAGIVQVANVEETTEELWQRVLRINIEAGLWLCQAVFPVMRAQGAGRIVLTVSGHGLAPAPHSPDLTAYSVSKGAQFGLMNALAGEGAPHGILVNAIAPVAATRVFRRSVDEGEFTPEQIAPGVAYLASEACTETGLVLRAGNGRFSVGQYGGTDGVDFGATPAKVADISARWQEVRGTAEDQGSR